MDALILPSGLPKRAAAHRTDRPVHDLFDATVAIDGSQCMAAALNAAASQCAGELFAVVAADVVCDDARVPDLLSESFDDPTVGIAAPVLTENGRVLANPRRVDSEIEHLAELASGLRRSAAAPRMPTDAPWVDLDFMVVRRAAFSAIGGFDERYALHFEDIALCVRMWSRGWRVRIDPRARVRRLPAS